MRTDRRAKANIHHFCSPVSSVMNIFHSSVYVHALEPIQDFLQLRLALLLAAVWVLDTAIRLLVHSAVLCKQVTSWQILTTARLTLFHWIQVTSKFLSGPLRTTETFQVTYLITVSTLWCFVLPQHIFQVCNIKMHGIILIIWFCLF